MGNIAFLGLGNMGARMCQHLLEAGHQVVVWNRTAARAKPLLSLGATMAQTPKLAVANADVVFSMLRDDAASGEVWLDEQRGALTGLKAEALAVECTTISVGHFGKLVKRFAAQGRDIIGAPVAGSLPQAEQKKLIFLVGANQAQLMRVQPLLNVMGAVVHHVGEGSSGVVLKLMVNSLLGVQVSLLAELLGFCEKFDVNPIKATEILAQLPVVSPALALAAQGMLAKNFAPNFPIDLVAKDFKLLLADAGQVVKLPVTKSTSAVFTACCEKGGGGDNITGVYKCYM